MARNKKNDCDKKIGGRRSACSKTGRASLMETQKVKSCDRGTIPKKITWKFPYDREIFCLR